MMEDKENFEQNQNLENNQETNVVDGNLETSNDNVAETVNDAGVEATESLEGVEAENAVATQENVESQNAVVEDAKVKKEKKTKSSKNKINDKVAKSKKKKDEAKVEEDLSNLSDDELYAKIQTEKLLRRKKNKRIATIVGLCVTFVLVVALIVLAAVPVSLKPRCMGNDFISATIYPGTTLSGDAYNDGDENFDKFLKYYNKSFDQSCISAIFDGGLFSYEIEEKRDNVPTLAELTSNNTYVVRLRYAENKKITYQNGKSYISKYSNSYWQNGSLTFNTLYFVVNKTVGFQETTVYVDATYPKIEDKVQTGTEQKLVKIKVKADTYQIYKAFDEGKI